MLRKHLYAFLVLSLVTRASLAAPVAVNDSYNTNEDTPLQAGGGAAIFSASFEQLNIASGTWLYLDKIKNNQNGQTAEGYPLDGAGLDWKSLNYNTATSTNGTTPYTWGSGALPLVGGTVDAVSSAVPVLTGMNSTASTVTTYLFRKVVTIDAVTAAIANWNLHAVADDGAIFYLNGVEIGRLGMDSTTWGPAGALSTLTGPAASGNETTFTDIAVNLAGILVPGQNVLAVEVHQTYSSGTYASSDIGLDMTLSPGGGGTEGFTYADNTFGTVAGDAYATGNFLTNYGNPGSSLNVTMLKPAFNNNRNVSGGWSRTITMPTAGTLRVQVDARLRMIGGFEPTEFGQAIVSVDGVRYGPVGTAPNFSLMQTNGDGGTSTSEIANSWQSFTVDIPGLAAGDHTIILGGYVSRPTDSFEVCQVYFDNILLTIPGSGSGVLANDTGGAVSATLVAGPANGTVNFAATGNFSYTPAANYSGPDSFTYTASDGTTNSNVGTVNITVNAVNDAPTGVGESYSTARNVQLVVPAASGVLLNDADIDTPQANLTAVLFANAQNGVVVLNPNGSFTYTPATDYFGADNFSYRVSDGALQSSQITVNLTVTSMGPPSAVADSYTLFRNSSLVVTQTTTGSVFDDVIAYGATGWKYLDNGSDQGSAWRAAAFNDASWASGPAELGYGNSDEATVVGFGPDSGNKYPTTYFRKKFNVSELHRVTNVEISLKYDDAGIVYINGTQVFSTPGLAPNVAYNAFSTASGGNNAFLAGNLTVPASMLLEGENTVAVEIHQNMGSSSDISMDLRIRLTKTVYSGVLTNDSDNEGDPFTAALVSNPTHGSMTLNPNGTFTYTPTAGYTGPDSFVYRAVDATGPSANTTVSLSIIAGPNQPPVVLADSYNATEDTTLNVAVAQGVLANDSDGEGDAFTAELVTGLSPAGAGSLSLNANGSFVFTPALNFSGVATFTYRARDVNNKVSAAATVTLNIAGVNDAPVAIAELYSTDPGVALNIPSAGVLANDTDADGDGLTASLVTGLSPSNAGSLTLNPNGSFNYIPSVGFSGTTTFVYRANDGTVNSANTTVTIRLNARPVANNDTYAATEDVPLTINPAGVLGNDSDAENDPLTAVLVSAPNPSQGSVVLNSNGSFTFTPAVNFNGAATFTYKVNDGGRDSLSDATVTINVAALNDAPTGVANSYVTPVNITLTVPVATGVLANDTDPEGDGLTAAVVAQPAHGVLTLNADGSFSFVPTTGYIGLDSFTYRASDAALQSAITTVNLQIGIDPKVVIINEIMYHPASNNDLEEYIELYNSGTGPLDLAGWEFTKGVNFVFPSVIIPAGGYLVVAADVAAFNSAYGSVPLIVGGWTGSLANSGEAVRLQFPDSTAADGLSEVDQVEYSKEGDWGLRRAFTDTETGWEWETRADGFGDSLELINPALTNSNGQNWTRREVAASGNQRSPGAANTDIALTPTLNSAPLISGVKHRPQIPNETQTVNVSAKLADEATTGVSGAVFYRTWTPNQSAAGANFSQIAMADDGLHGDGLANDGEFGATLPAHALDTIVEFYIRTTDSGGRARTWPAPTTNAGAQGANCLYQVDNETSDSRYPMYRFIATGLDQYEFDPARWTSASDASINVTFISQQETDFDVHYLSSIRVRGAGSRNTTPRNWKLEWPADNRFNNQRDANINIAYSHSQYLGAQLMKLANLPHEGATPVQVRLNSTNYAYSAGSTTRNGYGMYVHMQPIGDDTYLDQNFSSDTGGNIYKKVRPHQNFTLRDSTGAGYITDGWSKQSNSTVNNWADLHGFHSALNKVGGYTLADLEPVMDVVQWCRAMAFATIVNDAETNFSNGSGDDYGLYFGAIDSRAKLLMHDYDTILDMGDTTTSEAIDGIYQVTSNVSGGGSHLNNGETLPMFTAFYQDPVINQIYKAQIRDLLDTVFLPANFNATVDAHYGDWASPGDPLRPAGASLPSTLRDAVKLFNTTRRNFLLTQIAGTFSAATSLGVINGYPTTTIATNTGLSGTVDSVTTRKVTVNGIAASLDNYRSGVAESGTWTAGSAVTLVPGINQVVVRALGKDDVVLNSQAFEIVFDDSTVQNVASINGNTVWTAAGGPYRVTTALSIDNETLSIEPGTTVYVDPGMSFNVTGTGRILAEGTAALPIRMSKQPSATGTWNGVFLDEATEESRFVHVIFADNGTTAITAQSGSSVVVDNASFRNAGVSFLNFSGSSFSVSNTTFPDSTAAFPPMFASGVLAGGEAVIRDCVFGKTLGANASLTLTNMKRSGPIAQVLRNTFTGSQADLVVLNGCDGWVEGNTFLHAHKNSSAVKSSAIASGAFSTLKSNVTIIRNLIYDCDHAITMREGNAAAVVQNTIVHITNTGGTDTGSGVFNFANTTETPGSGIVAEANIIWGAAALTRTYNSAVTLLNLDNNIIPVAWTGSGSDNVVADPLLGLASIVTPGTATAAQVAAAFVPDANSPAIARGILGVADRGALIPSGILVAGAPIAPTPSANALLMFGPNGGFGTFATYGYTHFKAALDNGAYGTETSVSSGLNLSGLAAGTHTVSILGKNDAGVWQTTPTVVSWTVNPSAVTLQISEILASNVNAYPVGTTRPDMIEIHNYGTLAVSLTNLSVSDNPAVPRKYVFPVGTTIPAGGYLVLLGDAPNANPGLHIGFGLDADGDSFAIYPSASVPGTLPIDSVSFGAQIPDFSIGRAGLSRAWTLTTPSPLAANTAVVLGTNTGLKINEWCGSNDFIISSDFLELYNPTGLPVALGGMFLSADLQVSAQFAIAPLSYIAAGGFVRYVADSDTAAGPNHLSWSISKLRESMRLLTSSGAIVDQVVSGPQETDKSEGRVTDGSTTLAFFTLPTPGYSNNTALTTQQQIIDNLRITELMYNPSGGSNAPEFIELQNTSSVLTLDISGVKFSSGIDYTFPATTTLTPGQFIVITSNPTAFLAAYGFSAFNTTAYSGKLADGGERVRIEIGGFALGILDFTFSSAWYPTANATGASIEIINPLAERASWELKESWRATAPNPGLEGIFGVVAGDDLSLALPAIANLNGVVSYGSQNPVGVTVLWSTVSGPGAVGFSTPTALDTTASFSLPGIYVLRLTATGATTVSDTVTIYVQEDYSSWATRVIGSNPLTNGMLADADYDGVVNLLEYAMGTPQPGANTALLTPFVTSGLLSASFTRSSNANATFIVEVADALTGPWSSTTIVANMSSDNGLVQNWVAYDTRPMTESTKRFLRVRVVAN